MIYTANRLKEVKQVVAWGRMQGTGRTQVKAVIEVEVIDTTTVKDMSNYQYNDMMTGLYAMMRKNR